MRTLNAFKTQDFSIRRAGPLLLAGAFVLYTLWLAWVGWLDSDDHHHVDGGLGWYRDFPYLPQHHGEFRHLIAIPMGISFRLFGVSEVTLILWQLVYYAATLLLTYLCAGRAFGQRASLLALLVMASLPVFAIQATVVFSDITELFFITLSFWLFVAATRDPENRAMLWVSGAAVGCAWLTRETTIALILTYGLLFLKGWGIQRTRYFLLGAGFAVVVLAEAAFMYSMTGDPLFRYREILSARQTFSYHGEIQGDLFDAVGNVHVSRWLDPILALFVNHEFGILFIMSIPAVLWLLRNPPLSAEARGVARVLVLLGAIWFLASSLMLANMHPRYFTVTAYAASLVCALWIVCGVWPKRRAVAAILGTVLIGVGLMSIYVDNRNPLVGERGLKELLQTHSGVVHTDPETARRAGFLLWLDGLDNRVSMEAPVAGRLYYYNPNRERDLVNAGRDPKAYAPRAEWARVWEKREPERLLAIILRKSGLANKIHPSLYKRLGEPNRAVAAYRVTD